jgi:hypothetical protein
VLEAIWRPENITENITENTTETPQCPANHFTKRLGYIIFKLQMNGVLKNTKRMMIVSKTLKSSMPQTNPTESHRP